MRTNPLKRKQQLSAAQRRNQVASFMLADVYDQRTIAHELGCSQTTVSKDMKFIEAEWRSEMISKVDELKARDVARIDKAIAVIWPRIMRGDLDAIREFARLLARKAAMLGYDAPKVIDMRTAVEREVKRAANEYGLDETDVLAEVDRILAGEAS